MVKVKKHVLVIGAGRFGSAVALTLAEAGHEVVIVDRDEQPLRPLMEVVTHAAVADGGDEEALRELGVDAFDVVVVAMGGNFEAGVLATVAAKNAGASRVIAKANTATAAKVLTRVGANEVVRPEHDMGVRLAQQIATPSIVDAFALGREHEVVEVDVHDQAALLGKLETLALPKRFGVQVLAVTRGEDLHVSPGAAFALQAGDRVVVIGRREATDAFEREVGG